MEQELIDFLKDEDISIIFKDGEKELYWSIWTNKWEVLKNNSGNSIYSGDSLTEALKALKGDN